jgi:hypothetical protein
MVQEFDLEKVSAFLNAPGQAPIGLTGRRVTGRVIVKEDESIAPAHNGCPENLARMSEGLVKRANGNDMIALRLMLHVHENRNQMLLVGFIGRVFGNDVLPKYEDILRSHERSPCGSVVGEAGLSHPIQNDTKGSLRIGIIVCHNNFFQERTS